MTNFSMYMYQYHIFWKLKNSDKVYKREKTVDYETAVNTVQSMNKNFPDCYYWFEVA